MANLNKVLLIGRLIKDPELKYTASQTPVCNACMATNKTWMKDGTKQESTEFHNLLIWGKRGESFEKYLVKGREVYVEGELVTSSWEAKDGSKRYKTEINVNHFEFIGGNVDKNNALKSAHDKQQDYKVSTNDSFASDEIPF